jgi:Deoxynucleoside kinase
MRQEAIMVSDSSNGLYFNSRERENKSKQDKDFIHNDSFHTFQITEEPVEKWRNIPGGHNALALLYKDPQRWSMTLQTYVQLTMMQAHLKNEVWIKAFIIMQPSFIYA